MTDTRLAIGTMTGTSIDALDVALVRAHGSGTSMRLDLLRGASYELGDLAKDLRALATGRKRSAKHITELALALGELHANAIADLAGNDLADLSLISIHGQTVHHEPPHSWQLINPHPVAVRTSTRVVFDHRQADLALGGQGAPITPIADPILFPHLPRPFAVVNLGGFVNITRVSADAIEGADLCAGNQLLDALARELLNRSFDEGGELALAGWAQDDLVDDLVDLLTQQSVAGRSLGTGDELTEGFARAARDLPMPPEDVLASSVQAIAKVIAHAAHGAETVVLSGGGAHNRALTSAVTEQSRASVLTSDELGVPIDMREAMAMAALGLLCDDRVPITLPNITGRLESHTISGAWVHP